MKKGNFILTIILLVVFAGCAGSKQSTDDLIVVDVTKSYPKKELILQDFMDVEYIALETSDEFLTQGRVSFVGKDVILVRNRINDGNIFVYDKNGKGLRKINRRGQGGEEYKNALMMTLDEKNGEIFVNDHSAKKILIYDLYGNFKRSFKHKEEIQYDDIYNYDSDYLISLDGTWYMEGLKERDFQPFFLISKQDGSIFKEIKIQFKGEKSLFIFDFNTGALVSYRSHPLIRHKDRWILISSSSDTIFRYSPDHNMTPLIARTPSIQFMEPQVFLVPGIFSDRYYFMSIVKKEYDYEKKDYIQKKVMYDNQEKALYECTVYNDDFADKTVSMTTGIINDEIFAFYELLEAYELVEAYEKGQLKGRLKEIAAGLDVEDNPVIMLIKHKK